MDEKKFMIKIKNILIHIFQIENCNVDKLKWNGKMKPIRLSSCGFPQRKYHFSTKIVGVFIALQYFLEKCSSALVFWWLFQWEFKAEIFISIQFDAI